LLFDIQAVSAWLTAHGIVPGAHGREGGIARSLQVETEGRAGVAGREKPSAVSGQRSATKGKKKAESRPVKADSSELGLDATVGRLRCEEYECSKIMAAMRQRFMGGNGDAREVNRLLGEYKMWLELVDNLRKAEADLQKIRVQRGDLMPVNQFRRALTGFAGMVRTAMDSLPEELMRGVEETLQRAGVDIADRGVVRVVADGMRKTVGGRLEQLANEVRSQGGNG
jgi:hypothetical protein